MTGYSKVTFPNKFLPYLLLAPEVLIVMVFFIWPASQAVFQSVLMEDAFGISREFVGFKNYIDIFSDRLYRQSFSTSFRFGISVAFFSIAVALFLAAIATKITRGAMVYKTLIIWPYAIASLIAGVLWFFLFNPTVGILSYALRQFGIAWNHTIKGGQAFILVVIASTWKQISYNFLFYLAGMKNIPESLIEAAELDGATGWQKFWRVTFPLITPTTFFLVIMNFVYAFFDTFGVIHQLTRGGPNHATATLVYKVYVDGFLGMDLGAAAAQSVILMMIVILFSSLQFRFMERKVIY
jgi:sn-glycerol 3-phosphate transport system permease protein